jgi:hypothetical protein
MQYLGHNAKSDDLNNNLFKNLPSVFSAPISTSI